MSNLAKIYSEATGKAQLSAKRLEESEPQARDATSITESELSVQNKLDWLSHPRTAKMFEEIGDTIRELKTRATAMACSNQPNHIGIVQELCKASAFESILKTYCH